MKRTLINLKARIFSILPGRVRPFANAIRVLPKYASWYSNECGRAHTKSILAPFEGIYKGYRCVVIGNGPSLKGMDLKVLRNEYTIGLNRIYLLFKEWGFSTSFLVSVNKLVLEQFHSELQNVEALKLLGWSASRFMRPNESIAFVAQKPFRLQTSNIADGYLGTFGSVTNVALELALFLGFSQVMLIGVDHRFSEKGLGGKAIVSKGSDNDHFSPEYFGKGVVWQLPDYEVIEYGFKRMKRIFDLRGVEVLDATVNGNLNVFPKVDFYSTLKADGYKRKSLNEEPRRKKEFNGNPHSTTRS
jgi:hypothetical protein